MIFTVKAAISAALSAVMLAGCVFAPCMHSQALFWGNKISSENVFLLSQDVSGSTVNCKWVDSCGNETELSGGSNRYPLNSLKSADPVIPAKYDLRDFGNVPGVRYQGESGCCWAFSVIGAIESYDISHGAAEPTVDYSESHLIWFTNRSLISNASDTTGGDGVSYDSPYDNGGNWQRAAATLARWSGVADETDYPFNVDDYSSSGGYAESSRYINNGRILRSAEELSTPSEIKQAVISNGAVSAAMYYDDSKLTCAANGDYVYYDTAAGTNHCVLIVGWDDSYPAENFPAALRPASDGAYIIKNSWSEEWGNGGYALVSYETASLSQFAAFSAADSSGYDHNYQYDGFGYGGAVGMDNANIANVYTASSSENLKAVGFYTILANDTVTVSVYKNIPAGGDPGDGTLAYTSSAQAIALPGYHMIDLSEEIPLEAGERFAVALNYAGSSYFACEPYNTTSGGVSYASNAGESYFSSNISRYGWSTTASNGVGNVCIKAFTENNAETQLTLPVMPPNARVVGLDYIINALRDLLRELIHAFLFRLRQIF